MRLFLAVLLSEDMKNALAGAVEALRSLGAGGRFSRAENLHLTLAFLGETDIADAQRAARLTEEAAFRPFDMRLSGALGRFMGRRGSTLWAGLEQCDPLARLQSELTAGLAARGIRFDRKPFSPHLTLGREVVLPEGWDGVPVRRASQPVDCVSLMLSERPGGRLTYTEIARSKSIQD